MEGWVYTCDVESVLVILCPTTANEILFLLYWKGIEICGAVFTLGGISWTTQAIKVDNWNSLNQSEG